LKLKSLLEAITLQTTKQMIINYLQHKKASIRIKKH